MTKSRISIPDIESEVTRRVAIHLSNSSTTAMTEFMRAMKPFGQLDNAPREWFGSFNNSELGQLNVQNSNPFTLLNSLRTIMVDRMKGEKRDEVLHMLLDKWHGEAEQEEFVAIINSAPVGKVRGKE